MKNVIILFFSVFLWSVSYAQNNSNVPDPKLIDALGQDAVDFYSQNNPNLISYYNFFLNNSYQIVDMPEIKMNEIDKIPTMKLKEKFMMEPEDYSEEGLQKLNIMKYDIKIDPLSGAMYRLGNTSKLIVFYTGKEIVSMYNETDQKNK